MLLLLLNARLHIYASIYYRVRNKALVKSVLFETKDYSKGNFPSLQTMANNPKGRMNKIPFLCVNHNVGSTKFHDDRLKNDQNYSFGRPRFFFRFNFTSAIYDVPIAKVRWIDFVAVHFTRTTFAGHCTPNSWNETLTDDEHNSKYVPFVGLDDILPTRFVLSFDTNLDVAFIAQDQERLGVALSDGSFTDLGDDILQYKKGKPHFEQDSLIHPNMVTFLDMQIP